MMGSPRLNVRELPPRTAIEPAEEKSTARMSELDKAIEDSLGSFASVKDSVQKLLERFKRTALQSPISERPPPLPHPTPISDCRRLPHPGDCCEQPSTPCGRGACGDDSDSRGMVACAGHQVGTSSTVSTPRWSSESCESSDGGHYDDEEDSGCAFGSAEMPPGGDYLKHVLLVSDEGLQCGSDDEDGAVGGDASTSGSRPYLAGGCCRPSSAADGQFEGRCCGCLVQMGLGPVDGILVPLLRTPDGGVGGGQVVTGSPVRRGRGRSCRRKMFSLGGCGSAQHHVIEPSRHLRKYKARDVVTGKGQLKLALYINSGLLTVHVQKGKKLQSRRARECNSYVKVEMIPREARTSSCRTLPAKGTNSPVYDQKFSFELSPDVEGRRLFISVWHRDLLRRNSEFLGCMSFGIVHIMKHPVNGWYRILTEKLGKVKHFRVQSGSGRLTSILHKVRLLSSCNDICSCKENITPTQKVDLGLEVQRM